MVDIFRQRGFELYGFAAFGVDEAEPVGVQGLAGESVYGFFHRIGAGVARVAIHGVGDERVFGFAHMHADLVGAAGFEGAFNVAVALVAFEHFDVGHGFFAAEADHGHFDAGRGR